MYSFQQFNFSDEDIIAEFRRRREIPVDFYNREGQILIYKQKNVTENEIQKLLNFVPQGIFYNVQDARKLGLTRMAAPPEGLTHTKLITEQQTAALNEAADAIFDRLKSGSLTYVEGQKAGVRVARVFEDFEKQPDVMTGVLNILAMMKERTQDVNVELAVKRTVVAMAFRVRSMQTVDFQKKSHSTELAQTLMMSAMLCDIGYAKMDLPTHAGLNKEEMKYIRNHPFLSYLIVAPVVNIDPRVKHNILNHHRPNRSGVQGNNYPTRNWLKRSLEKLTEVHRDLPESSIHDDLKVQTRLMELEKAHHEDANILALSSEYASLTSQVSWRSAFAPVRAVRMMVNNSLFTYSYRYLREFLDHVSISLCGNIPIFREGDYVIVGVRNADSGSHFEVCRIESVGRYQSRQYVRRIGFVKPVIHDDPKLHFKGFLLESLRADPRSADFNLARDHSRQLVYAVDPEYDEELHESIHKLER